jgi:hypothetical protein
VGHLQSLPLDWRVRVVLGSTVLSRLAENHNLPI